MNSNVEVSDDHKIQIIISSSNHIPSQSHEQTPVATSAAAASATPQHESRGVSEITLVATSAAEHIVENEITPEERSSLKDDLCKHILWGEWREAQTVIDKYPDMVRIPLNDSRRDTALHVAVYGGSITCVIGLVKLMNPEDLLIPNSQERLPVHLAALYGDNKMVQVLSSENVLDKMASKDIERLFFMTIESNMFDVAMKLFEKYPTTLAMARNEENFTALHMLAQKSPEFPEDNNTGGSSQAGLELLKKLWTHVRKMENKKDMELICSTVLFDAVKSGNAKAVFWLIDNNRELLSIKDPNNGRNLLHLVVLYRKDTILKRMDLAELIEHLELAKDNEGNNVLHFAAHLPLECEALSSFRARIQM